MFSIKSGRRYSFISQWSFCKCKMLRTSRQQACHMHVKRDIYFGKMLRSFLCVLTVCSFSLSDTLYCEELNEKIRLLYRLHIPPGSSFNRHHSFRPQSVVHWLSFVSVLSPQLWRKAKMTPLWWRAPCCPQTDPSMLICTPVSPSALWEIQTRVGSGWIKSDAASVRADVEGEVKDYQEQLKQMVRDLAKEKEKDVEKPLPLMNQVLRRWCTVQHTSAVKPHLLVGRPSSHLLILWNKALLEATLLVEVGYMWLWCLLVVASEN